MQSFPFNHKILDGFLSPPLFERVASAYGSLQFHEKHTDLFHFFQTNELRDEVKLREFLEHVRKELVSSLREIGHPHADLSPESEVFGMDLFASYYNKGHYLLCHDDCLDERVFAFSFYLSGSEGGALILYGPDALTCAKRVETLPNRLVLFEVSQLSYHEVEMCQGPRTALTGWLRIRGRANESCRMEVERSGMLEEIFSKEKAICIDTYLHIPNPSDARPGACSLGVEDKEIERLEENLRKAEWIEKGPRTERRLLELSHNTNNLSLMKECSLTPLAGEIGRIEVVKIPLEGYLLLNDSFNEERGSTVIVKTSGLPPLLLVSPSGEVVLEICERGMFLSPEDISFFIKPSPTESFLVLYKLS
jgi:2OG-Fe(II) oxygenase superfamily